VVFKASLMSFMADYFGRYAPTTGMVTELLISFATANTARMNAASFR